MKKLCLVSLLSLFMFACGGGGNNVSSLDQLPKMTAPVVTSAQSAQFFTAAATSGLNFTTVTTDSFDEDSSRSMCETMNVAREVLDRAAQGDEVLCYVQQTLLAEANAGKIANPYDGNEHIIELTGVGEIPDAVAKFKFKVVKNGNSITEFKMFMCMDGENQSEYQRQVINNDGSVSIVNKGVNVSQAGTWKSHLTVAGMLDSNNNFISKTIDSVTGWYESDTRKNAQSADITQYSDTLV